METAQHWLKKELDQQKAVQNNLEEVKGTLEKNLNLEKKAEEFSNNWKNQLAQSEQRADLLEEELQALT